MEGVNKGQSKPMLPSSSRLSPLAKPFSLKKGHDHQQHVRMDMRCFPEGDWTSFSGLPSVPSLDLDNYLKKEADVKGGRIRSLSCEKGIGSSSLISSQPYSSMVARILDEYGPEKEAKESDLFDCDQKMISSGSNHGFQSPNVDSGWGLQKDESSIGRQDGFLFKGKDALNSLAFHSDMNKGHQTSKLSRLLDETCNSVNAVVRMKFTGAEHEHGQGDAKLPRRAYDPYEDLFALDRDCSVMPKSVPFNTFGGQCTLSADHPSQSSVLCQSWVNQLVSSPGKNLVSPVQNIDYLQPQAFLQTRSNMDSSIAGVDTSSSPVVDSPPAVKCHAQFIETSTVSVDSEIAAEGIETVGDVAPHLGRIKLGRKEIEKDDSDVDSPCWKGLSFNQSHSRAYGASDSQHPDAKLIVKNALNPSAPQFFPQNAKSWSSYEESKFATEDLFSFARPTSAPPTEVLPETLDLDEDFCSPVIYGPRWHTAQSDMSDHGNKFLQKGDEKLHFCLDQPHMEDNYFRFTSETERLTGFTGQESDRAGPAAKKAISVPLLSGPNAAGTLSEQNNPVPVPTSPAFIGDTNFSASAAINMSLNGDEEVLVNTMLDLSKLLLTKCHGGRSFDKLNHERIQTVISNLLICVGGVHAKRDSMHEPAISDKSYEYADAFTKTDSVILRKGSHEASGSSSGAPIRIHQSSEKTQSAICFNEVKISQHTELYRTLWLEAQAELSSLKCKAATSHTKF